MIAGLIVVVAALAPDPFVRELEARQARFYKEGSRAQAVVPLLGLSDLWERVPERAALLKFVDGAASSKARADVRARATWMRAAFLDRIGRGEEADKARASLGLITKCWLVGPFDNEGRAGHATAFGPEEKLDLAAEFSGKERRVAWRRLPNVVGQGVIALDAALRPEGNGTAYLAVAVKAPRATAAALRIGSTGAIKAWVNGRLALDRDVYRPLRFDQDAAYIELAAGWNRVLIKSSAADRGWKLMARLSAPDGGPLAGLEFSTEPRDLAAAPLAKGAFRGRVADLQRDLLAAAHKKDPRALFDLGLYLHHVAPEDPEAHRAAEVLGQAAQMLGSGDAWLAFSRALSDGNEQREALEAGLAVTPEAIRAPLLAELGDEYHGARRERRAEALWLQALKADPAYWPARLKLCELSAERGLPGKAAAQLADLMKGFATPPLALLRAEIQLAHRRARRAEAESALRRLLSAQAHDDEALLDLVGVVRGRGNVEEALALLEKIARLRPDLQGPRVDRAELLENQGRLDEAQVILAATLEVAPDDARLHERLGRLLHRKKNPQALDHLRRALELRPQNPELRSYLAELEPKRADGSDLERAYAVDAAKAIAEAKKKKAPAGLSARVLLDLDVTRVHPNGLSESFQQRMVEVLDRRGAREQGETAIRFTPDTQSVEVRAARLHKASGEIIEATSTDEQDLSEPWYGLYYDVKAQVVRFAAVEPGDVVEISYLVSDVGGRNLFADYFGDLHFFQEDLPRLESRWVLIAPRERKLYFNQPRLALRSDEERGADHIYTFVARDTPKVESEPGMPGFSEAAAYVHVSTYRRWEDVAAWYAGLIKPQMESSPQIRRAAEEATRDLVSEQDKIRAVYQYVIGKTRYVGLEFGIHGYQPYKLTQVLARKFGDCKDKAALMVAMLRELGIPSTMALARTRRGGNLDAEPASLAPFDHAIAYVPKYDWYLDGTAEFSGAHELPAQDQDIPVLLVSTGKLVRTPVLPAPRNQVVTEWRVALDESGAARVEEQLRVTGEAAHGWRSHYQSPGERENKYARAWNEKHPGAKLEKLRMEVESRELPVAVQAEVTVPHWARPVGESRLTMAALGREPDMLKSYARLSSRKHDLILGYPWRQQERVKVALPPGWRTTRLPVEKVIESPIGVFSISVSKIEGEVTVISSLEVNRHRIAKADYAAFRKFCQEVDAAVAQELTVEK